MNMPATFVLTADGDATQDLGLQSRSETLYGPQATGFRCGFEIGKRDDSQLSIDLQHLLRSKSWHREHFKDAGGNLFAHLLKFRMRAGFVQLRDDVPNCITYAGDLLQSPLSNQSLKRYHQRGQTVGRARVR